MGGPRGSTMRQLYSGKSCCECHRLLPERTDGRTGERRCTPCVEKFLHTVAMNFMKTREGWYVSFLEADARTSLPWTGTFADEGKLYDLVRRSYQAAEAERELENQLRVWGRGTVRIRLDAEQYARLKRQNRPTR